MTDNRNRGTDLKRLKAFLLWAKDEEIEVGELQIGDIRITLTTPETYAVSNLVLPTSDEFEPGTNKRIERAAPQNLYDDIYRRMGVVANE